MQKKNKSSWQIDFKIHYKAKVFHYLWKDKHAEQWNRRENPELELHVGNQLIFWQWCHIIQRGKISLYNKLYWNCWIYTWEEN